MKQALTWFFMGLCGGMGFHVAQGVLAFIVSILSKGL